MPEISNEEFITLDRGAPRSPEASKSSPTPDVNSPLSSAMKRMPEKVQLEWWIDIIHYSTYLCLEEQVSLSRPWDIGE